jgi:hypothetical protein
VASGNLPSGQQSIAHWFDTSAFVAPPLYSFGNSGTGILTGPGYFDLDLGIVRMIPITERIALNIRGEAFNAFNRANFSNPNATIGTGPAGIISATQPARIIQMAVKLVF